MYTVTHKKADGTLSVYPTEAVEIKKCLPDMYVCTNLKGPVRIDEGDIVAVWSSTGEVIAMHQEGITAPSLK